MNRHIDILFTKFRFNDSFTNLSQHRTPVSAALLSHYQNNCLPGQKFNFRLVAEEDIFTAINEIKSRAIGCDGISLSMLIFSLPFIMKVLADLFNECLTRGVLPDLWKIAIVQPIPKVANPDSYSKLRPISILPVLSKILEKIVNKMINEFVDHGDLIPQMQSGFRAKFSTCTALSRVTTDLSKIIDDSRVACLVLLDYSRAFDLIDHELLLAKLHFVGFGDQACSWIRAVLTGRSQIVEVDGQRSRSISLECSVPQGSILSPILFSLFTFDLVSVLQCSKSYAYADDNQLIKSINPLSPTVDLLELNCDLDRVHQWSLDHGLKLNALKSCLIYIGTPHQRQKMRMNAFIPVHINGEVIPEKEHSKNLGLTFDRNLDFEQHVLNIVRGMYIKLKSLYSFKYLLPESVKWRLVESLIFPLFEYCLPAYFGFLTNELKNRIQCAQNSCVRYVYCIRKYDHISPVYNAHQHLKASYKYRYATGVLLKSVFDNKKPEYLLDMFKLRRDVHNRNLRGNFFDMIPHKTAQFECCFLFVAVHLLNNSQNLYTMICDLSKHSFKVQYKKLLLSNQRE